MIEYSVRTSELNLESKYVQKITKKRTRNMRRKYWELDSRIETKIITGAVSIIRYSRKLK